MLGVRVELLVLGDFLDDLLADHVVVYADVARVQLDVVVARHCGDFDCFLGGSLRVTRETDGNLELSLLHAQL